MPGPGRASQQPGPDRYSGQVPDSLRYDPLIPGGYPPLGYADDGTPLYLPGQQTDTEKRRLAAAQDATEREAAQAQRAEVVAEREAKERMGALALGAFALVVVVALAAMYVFTRGDDDLPIADRTIPQAPRLTEPAEPPPLPSDVPDFDDEFREDTQLPPLPSLPNQLVAPGEPVDYEATLDGPGTVFYADASGMRAEFVAPGDWNLSFVSGNFPLHLTVIPAPNTAATCVVRIDGQEVISDEVSAENATQNLARCVP